MSKEIVSEWLSLKPGDIVKVANEKGEFAFISAVIDTETNTTMWVNVHGGRKGRHLQRAFAAERIIAPSEKVLQKQRIAREGSNKGEK